jgi:membrane protease YdiL (CAAX protease family)
MNDFIATAPSWRATPAWRRALFGGLWFLAFCTLGAVCGAHVRFAVPAALHMDRYRWIGAGTCGGLALVNALAWANLLPGARARPTAAPGWGAAEALWLCANFALMQLTGTVLGLLGMSAIIVMVTQDASRATAMLTDVSAQVAMAMCGYLTATLWAVIYVRGAGPARVADGSARGIGWRPAPPPAYAVALGLAVAILIAVHIITRYLPPDPAALKDAPFAHVFDHPGWAAALLVVLAVFVAPFAEEWVFRGGLFGGLATRIGPWGAAAVTTILFVVAHAQEKIHYPPGFIDVGLAAAGLAWLRLRYGSIRPGILLHLTYNLGVTLASAAWF